MSERVVPECAGCLKAEFDRRMLICSVFKDPAYQHRNGQCYGYTSSAKEMAVIFYALADYSSLPNAKRHYKAVAQKWDEEYQRTVMPSSLNDRGRV